MDKKDHDLLVTLTNKMDELCRVGHKSDKGNKEAHDAILKRIDDNHEKTDKWVSAVHDRIDDQLKTKTDQVTLCHKTFVQSKVFYWVAGFIIIGVVSAWSTIAIVGKEFDTRMDKVEVVVEQQHPSDKH